MGRCLLIDYYNRPPADDYQSIYFYYSLYIMWESQNLTKQSYEKPNKKNCFCLINNIISAFPDHKCGGGGGSEQ
jgi:hypothetical protein